MLVPSIRFHASMLLDKCQVVQSYQTSDHQKVMVKFNRPDHRPDQSAINGRNEKRKESE